MTDDQAAMINDQSSLANLAALLPRPRLHRGDRLMTAAEGARARTGAVTRPAAGRARRRHHRRALADGFDAYAAAGRGSGPARLRISGRLCGGPGDKQRSAAETGAPAFFGVDRSAAIRAVAL